MKQFYLYVGWVTGPWATVRPVHRDSKGLKDFQREQLETIEDYKAAFTCLKNSNHYEAVYLLTKEGTIIESFETHKFKVKCNGYRNIVKAHAYETSGMVNKSLKKQTTPKMLGDW